MDTVNPSVVWEPSQIPGHDVSGRFAPGNSANTNGRDAHGRFTRGNRVNSPGRPREIIEARDLARQHGPKAIRRLARMLDSANDMVAIAAAKILLDRGYGTAPQSVSITPMTLPTEPVTDLNEQAAILRHLMSDPRLNPAAVRFALAPPEAAP